MAHFMCQFEDCRNDGEKEFFRACEANLGDEIVVYHNRYIDGMEFDFCLLIPEYGILLVEVKGWNKETYLGYKYGKLWIRDGADEKKEDPYKEVRDHKYALDNLILNHLGIKPLMERAVCFTRWEDEFVHQPDLVAYMGHTDRLLFGKDDIENKDRFYQKLYSAFIPAQREKRFFSDDQMFKIMDFFDPGFAREELERQRKEDPVTPEKEPGKKKDDLQSESKGWHEIPPYSIIAIVQEGSVSELDHLIDYYSQGTKITAILVGEDLQKHAAEKLTALYHSYSIKADGTDLIMSGEDSDIPYKKGIRLFYWSSYVIAPENELANRNLFVVDGKCDDDTVWETLALIDAQGFMNLAQYKVEHATDQKHILVKAGAGTGKTSVMIDRIAYLVYCHQMSPFELRDRILMITFTDDAADNMSRKLKQRFQNLYLLTGNGGYLAMVGQINQMQISTIHSYALDLIKKLCVFSGYSNDLAVESGQYNRKKHLKKALEEVAQEKIRTDRHYIQKLGLPFYEIREKLLKFVGALENKSIDLTRMEPASFGQCPEYPLIHELFMEVISRAEKEYAEELKDNGKIFLGRLMPELVRAVENGVRNNRLQEGLVPRDRYLFVDEFQDTDDYQIQVILQIVEAMKYHLFCVGDQKQCIYRFRGAEEQAFDKLRIDENKDKWEEPFFLVHNYRTDNELLQAFEPFFIRWGQQGNLVYDPDKDKLDNPIKSNGGAVPPDSYMRRITVKDKEDRIPALFEEVCSRMECIRNDPEYHRSKEDRTIAILVRENWQARDILDYARSHFAGEFVLETETGGDLFQSDPAIDMLSLCQTLQKDDPAVLSHFAESNLIQAHVSKARLYGLKEQKTGDRLASVVYLHSLINGRLEKSAGKDDCRSLDELRSRLRYYPVMQVLHQVYMQLKPWDYLPEGQLYRLNVDELFERFVRGGTGEGTSLDHMTEYLSNCIFSRKEAERRIPDQEEDNRPIVKCLTVHKSKGLEYGYVILPFTDLAINELKKTGMDVIIRENGRIGYNFIIKDDESMHNNLFDEREEKEEKVKEETRVLYVAMTRARKCFTWIETEKNGRINWQYLLSEGGIQE